MRVALLALFVAGCGGVTLVRLGKPHPVPAVAHYGHDGTWLLPDPKFSPGKVRTENLDTICKMGTKPFRHTPPSLKVHIRTEYGQPPHPSAAAMEVDHIIPLELGGADDSLNLFAQPGPQFHTKDKLENFLHSAVCAGKIKVRDAQTAIATDWVQAARNYDPSILKGKP